MQILSAQQIRDWDAYTIRHQGISSFALMERAAGACADWIIKQKFTQQDFTVFCGKGNNGGDGLAIARLLHKKGKKVTVYTLQNNKEGSPDFEQNLAELSNLPITVIEIKNKDSLPALPSDTIIIDAIIGAGLKGKLEGLTADLVQHINQSSATVIAIDLPTGLLMDHSSMKNPVICADYTLTFGQIKLPFLIAENDVYTGQVIVLDIGLSPEFLEEAVAPFELITKDLIQTIYKPRKQSAHKGNFGHSLIIAGSYGKMGAAMLATAACLKTGAGLVTAFVPKVGYQLMQQHVPEAMTITSGANDWIDALPDLEKFDVIGIGPGLGQHPDTQKMVLALTQQATKPLVLDADALNILSQQKDWSLPPFSVITPHPKEFDRLFGEHQNDFDRLHKAIQKAKTLHIIIVLKGHHTVVYTPGGLVYFNNTGNAGMATGGSGDVLTGIITSLAGQNYPPIQAALLGVYLHGLAGDFAAHALSQESLLASDIINHLAPAFKSLASRA